MNKCWFNLFVSNMQGGNNINVNNKKKITEHCVYLASHFLYENTFVIFLPIVLSCTVL